MTQSIAGTVTGLFAACQGLYGSATGSDLSPVFVSLGDPGSYQPLELVVVGAAIRQPITRPTMTTTRSREKTAEIDVLFSVIVPGMVTEDVTASGTQADALARVLALTDQLEAYFRTKPNEELGGACRESWVSNIVGPVLVEAKDKDGRKLGRLAELTVTITAAIRY